jgi:hypothetical protein
MIIRRRGASGGTSSTTATTDTSGTPGNASANTLRGRAALPGDSVTTAITITNPLVRADSTVLIQIIGSGGANKRTHSLEPPVAGSFTVNVNAAATSGTLPFNWTIIN